MGAPDARSPTGPHMSNEQRTDSATNDGTHPPSPIANNELRTCWCFECLDAPELGLKNPTVQMMILCPACGNKRCPRATDHRYACTGSNEVGQFGSRYTAPCSETALPSDLYLVAVTWLEAGNLGMYELPLDASILCEDAEKLATLLRKVADDVRAQGRGEPLAKLVAEVDKDGSIETSVLAQAVPYAPRPERDRNLAEDIAHVEQTYGVELDGPIHIERSRPLKAIPLRTAEAKTSSPFGVDDLVKLASDGLWPGMPKGTCASVANYDPVDDVVTLNIPGWGVGFVTASKNVELVRRASRPEAGERRESPSADRLMDAYDRGWNAAVLACIQEVNVFQDERWRELREKLRSFGRPRPANARNEGT